MVQLLNSRQCGADRQPNRYKAHVVVKPATSEEEVKNSGHKFGATCKQRKPTQTNPRRLKHTHASALVAALVAALIGTRIRRAAVSLSASLATNPRAVAVPLPHVALDNGAAARATTAFVHTPAFGFATATCTVCGKSWSWMRAVKDTVHTSLAPMSGLISCSSTACSALMVPI